MTKIVLTYEDFVALPDDGRRYELHEGELSVSPAPTPRHQSVIGNLFLIIAPHVRASGRGQIFPVAVRLISERALEGSPSLAIEVLSASSITIDRRRKMALYAAHDVTWYWIVDPDALRIEAYRLHSGAYRVEGILEGAEPRALPPFPDLPLEPLAIWAS